MIKEKAYAKLNLSLKILGKAQNGYHLLESVVVPISLHDSLYFKINNSNEMKYVGPKIENNSILKAAKLFQETYNTQGATIKLVKKIPMDAGLGGGSADSSATLRGLNQLFKLNKPLKELEYLAKQLGSDNVFCLYNKAAICRGVGSELEFIDAKFKFNAWIIKPEFGLSTKEVFANYDHKASDCNCEKIINALKHNDYKLLDENIFNDLLAPALVVKPELKNIIEEIKHKNINVHMSGSGTTLFIFNPKLRIKEVRKVVGVKLLKKKVVLKRYHN